MISNHTCDFRFPESTCLCSFAVTIALQESEGDVMDGGLSHARALSIRNWDSEAICDVDGMSSEMEFKCGVSGFGEELEMESVEDVVTDLGVWFGGE